MEKEEPIIRASEVNLYAYCARAWWLGQVLGYQSTQVAAMRQGTVQHRAHGRSVAGFHRLRRLAVALLLLAAAALVAGLLLGVGR